MAIIKRINFTDGFSSETTPSETIVAGSSFLVGEGVPSDIDDGNDTDYYMDSETGNIYLKTAGAWALYTALETTPALAAHIADTTDVHAASAITNTPSGNIAATDVQAALNELQTDIDSRALDSALSAHTGDTTDAHDASAISSVAAGNLAATDVQTALDELQTDIDTRLLASSLTTHESDTSTHGVGTIVGTSETQALTNKDIDGGTATNTSRITLPKADKTVLDALTRKEGTIVYDSTGNTAYIDDGSTLVELAANSATVHALYTSNSGAAIGTSVAVHIFEDLVSDTHSAYNTGTGEYTVPTGQGGVYLVAATITSASFATSTTGRLLISMQVNGTGTVYNGQRMMGNGASTTQASILIVLIELAAGDDVMISSVSSVATTGNTAVGLNHFSIARIK